MGKTYIDTIKYMVKANFEINGIVEKPDIVGAVFGQTEGLLGGEMDLREMQKNGRIGRIEVETTIRRGKTFGTILVPSSLDIVETSILAASLEVVDRVGPCEASIKVEKIEDSRNTKRKVLIERAKVLLKTMISTEMPESREITALVRNEFKKEVITTYGEERLPAGPEIQTSEEIILVEGRADVINLLKSDINNAIAIGGAKVGPTIIDLCKKKEVTVFLDGDRGGDIILNELIHATDIDFVARAPPGIEVEEMTRKELIQCLRRKMPLDQYLAQTGKKFDDVKARISPTAQSERTEREEEAEEAPRSRFEKRHSERAREERRPPSILAQAQEKRAREKEPEVDPETRDFLKAQLAELNGSLKARIFDEGRNVVVETQIRELISALEGMESIGSIALDGIITQRLVDIAAKKNAKQIAGVREGNITKKPEGIAVVLA